MTIYIIADDGHDKDDNDYCDDDDDITKCGEHKL
jgi:hypothetical protein